MKNIHVFYLARDTTADHVVRYVKECRPSAELQVEKIVARSDYASFRIGVPEGDFHDLMALNFWPAGVAINEWRWRSPRFAPAPLF